MGTKMMTVEISIAANATNNNVLRDLQYQVVPNDALLTFYETGSAAGLVRTLIVAGQAVDEGAPINANNRIPIVPDDKSIEGVEAYQGNPITVKVQNTTGGALTYRGRVEIVDAMQVE